jgi:hypothetical protein
MNHFDKEHYSEQPAAKLLYTYPDVLPGTSTHKKPETLPLIPDSYLTQWYRVSIGGREFALRPVDNSWEMDELWPEAVSAAESPAESDMLSGFVVGYWNADGDPSNAQARAEQSEKATGLAVDITDEAIALVTCERDNRWFEPALLLPGIERGQAQTLARELGRPLRCALIDSDVLISPLADNIFEAVREGRIGIVSRARDMPMELRRVTNRIAFYRREFMEPNFPLNSLLNATPRQIFEWAGLEPAMDDFACTGVLVCDSVSHAELFQKWYEAAPSDERYHAIGDWEQTYVNHQIQQRPDIQWLDYSWQAIWMFEAAENYPFLYSSSVEQDVLRWCVTSSLLKHQFLHLAGRWEATPDARSLPALPEVSDMSEFIERLRVQAGASEPAQMRGKLAPPPTRALP